MIFEGLVKVDYGMADGKAVLWGLMVDATKGHNDHQVPPCVHSSLSTHYKAHRPAIFVEKAKVFKGTTELPPLIPLNNDDVTVTTREGFGIVDLKELVSTDELKLGFGNPAAALNVEAKHYTDPVLDLANDALIARIRLEGGDLVQARANVCQKRQPGLKPHERTHLRFEADPTDHDGKCNGYPGNGITPMELGDDVIVTQENLAQATLTLTNRTTGTRVLRIVPNPGVANFGIAFRNTMPIFHEVKVDACAAMAAEEHFASYRWYYRLEARDETRCKVAPCRACEPKDPFFKCSAAGFKCPVP